MAFERYIRSGQRRLRCGYTTGTCAALAASGAARLLLIGESPETLSVLTPKGWIVEAAPRFCVLENGIARCGVVKDAGDDPDVTNGCLIVAEVRKTDAENVTDGATIRDSGGEITIDGGEGVGRVTKSGLDQPIGAAAINRVPRRMIADAVREVRDASGYVGGLSVTISVPDGERLARKTFNPNLGIVGGISILGASGIVEPMSERALIDSIALEIRQAALTGNRLILTPGNYGLAFLHQTGLDALGVPVVRFSNYVGDALDIAATHEFASVLIVGHVGKLVKLAGGIMNTHSRVADCRNELFCAYAAVCGANTALCRAVMDAPTTDACLTLLDAAGLRQAVTERLLDAVQRHLERRVEYRVGAVMFSNERGALGRTRTAERILTEWRGDAL